MLLQAENTRFRVHRSILSHHSSFFQDLALLPQPSNSADVIENGTHLLEMACDQADEWSRMLYVIYNPLLFYKSYNEFAPLTIMAMLRLGHKYQFSRLEELPRDWVCAARTKPIILFLIANPACTPICHPTQRPIK
ncbi:hypothetical protein CPC08DRAFT_721458 [Agrocybe pediades]|nr:hypothetical protein CPC08DRAFT_721458 [Agrocybe pediades]